MTGWSAAEESRVLLATSWRLVRRPGLLVPALAALVLVVATAPVLDEGWALQVLRGVGVLLACAWVSATDEPAGEVVAASPYPRRVRTVARVAAAAPVLLAVWLVAALVVEARAAYVPVLGLGLEALGLGVLGLALGAGLRAWHDLHRPAQPAALALVLAAFVMSAAPRWYALLQEQTWGPPWEAAQLRWLALLLVAAGVLALALHDPVHRPPHGGRAGREVGRPRSRGGAPRRTAGSTANGTADGTANGTADEQNEALVPVHPS